ncbi:MAG: tRNA (guanosine(37)-N1)-methyltransferase TrmD [Candidatus Peribacteria bacterium]|nr:MAG: tRNA (guanosine(37)-N1)-methyltransferase TrmD [Candidatus Peribacteria bacterium]
MKVHIISLFPEAFESYFSSSILGRAIDAGLFQPVFYKLHDFSEKKFGQVDDKAYGMHGQVISPEPLSKAIHHVFQIVGRQIPVVYMTPRGEVLHQSQVETYYEHLTDDFIIICGHYEGIDERIIEKYVDYSISIGEYVLTSGEIAAQVFLDALVRHIPGVLGNPTSLEEESFSKKLHRQKEYPVYTRPEIFEGMAVPEVLTSGNHAAIECWKQDNLS